MVKVGMVQTPSVLQQLSRNPWISKVRQFKWVLETLKRGWNDPFKGPVDLLVFPEVWTVVYDPKHFRRFAEPVPPVGSCPLEIMNTSVAKIEEMLSTDAPVEYILKLFKEHFKIDDSKHTSPTSQCYVSTCILSAIAQMFNVHVLGGTITEVDTDEKVYNCFTVYNPKGELIQKARKAHLFDIDIPNRIRFKESEAFSPGQELSAVDLPWGRFGLGVCYDLRFSEVALILRERGAKFLVYPSNFNTTTGPLHYEALLRARAIDTQCFVLGPAPSVAEQPADLEMPVNVTIEFPSHAHSIVVDPWGTKILDAGLHSGYFTVDMNEDLFEVARAAIPIFDQKRRDLYEIVYKPALKE